METLCNSKTEVTGTGEMTISIIGNPCEQRRETVGRDGCRWTGYSAEVRGGLDCLLSPFLQQFLMVFLKGRRGNRSGVVRRKCEIAMTSRV